MHAQVFHTYVKENLSLLIHYHLEENKPRLPIQVNAILGVYRQTFLTELYFSEGQCINTHLLQQVETDFQMFQCTLPHTC